jgi:serine/threonine protein kinase
MTLQPGTTFAGHYQPIAPLGQREDSWWRARDTRSGAERALKLVGGLHSPKIGERFRQEAAQLGALAGQGIPRLIEHGVVGDEGFLVVELLQGKNLRALLSVRRRLSAEETLALMRQIVVPLSLIHQQGLLHRRLRPSSIFLVDGKLEQAMLLDVGTTGYEMPRGTVPLMVMAVSPYQSPEQVQHLPGLDARADLWSLACIVFECITGEKPFGDAGKNHAENALLAQYILKNEEATPSAIFPKAPPALDVWWRRASAKSPQARFASCHEFLADLESAITPRAPVAPPAKLGRGATQFLSSTKGSVVQFDAPVRLPGEVAPEPASEPAAEDAPISRIPGHNPFPTLPVIGALLVLGLVATAYLAFRPKVSPTPPAPSSYSPPAAASS